MLAQEKARVVDEMQERIDTLEKSLENVKKEEGAKMTLLRSRLSQVEKQKGELAEKNVALDGVMLGLKKKVEDLVKERNSSATSSQKAAASDDAATTTATE
jgi:predicted  nucleic acid-binding Zn-ribbon protein